MSSAWELLERAGVPFGARAEPVTLGDPTALVAAVREALANAAGLSPRQRVSLMAWLGAWASDWPLSFARAFGSSADDVLAAAAAGVDDAGRYLKLRRLARDRLAAVL